MSENPIGVPWDQPGADPIGDIRRYIEEARNQPFLVKIKVTQRTYDMLREITKASWSWMNQPLDWYIAAWTGVTIEVDDTLPADPGWEAVWST